MLVKITLALSYLDSSLILAARVERRLIYAVHSREIWIMLCSVKAAPVTTVLDSRARCRSIVGICGATLQFRIRPTFWGVAMLQDCRRVESRIGWVAVHRSQNHRVQATARMWVVVYSWVCARRRLTLVVLDTGESR